MNLWLMALKTWNKAAIDAGEIERWTIPKKGTEQYREVREVLEFLKQNPRFFKGAEDLAEEIQRTGPDYKRRSFK